MNISNRPASDGARAAASGWEASSSFAVNATLELPLFLQIARGLSDAIRDGRLRTGARLPGTRTLARRLRVHRNTVLAAYSELVAEGWIETSRASGSFVSHELETDGTSRARSHKRRPSALTRGKGRPSGAGFALGELEPDSDTAPDDRRLLMMGGGVPDLRLVPAAALGRAYRRALRRHSGELLGYGDAQGLARLRSALADMLGATRGVACTADDVLVTRGSQMALDLVARTLITPGDVVAVEALGYPPAWQALRLAGAKLVSLPVDSGGLVVDALASLLEKTPVRAVYVTPHHQFPTLVTLTASRRLALLELARRHQIAIIEDDYDHEFHYEWRPVLPLAASDDAGVVVYVGTLAKIFAPGIRIGWLVGARRFIEQATRRRVYVDRQGDQTVEHAICELLEDGEIQRHARRVRRIYARRRQALVDALERELAGVLSFEMPHGGMALWARAAPRIDVEEWARRAQSRGVLVQPGRRFSFDRRRIPNLRMGFAALDESEIERGVRALKAAL